MGESRDTSFNVREVALTDLERKKIRSEIKPTLQIGYVSIFVLLIAIALFLGAVFGIGFLFFSPPEKGVGQRILFIAAMFSILLLVPLYQALLFYLDLKHGRKIIIESMSYQIMRNRNKVPFLQILEPIKRKIDLPSEDIISKIRMNGSITVELTKYSKTVLFISNDSVNLLV